MPRTDAGSVTNTFDTSVSTGAVEDWIAAASGLVDDIEDRSSLSSDKLERIERLVAQHFLAAQDQRAESRSSASRSVTYQGDHGMGFTATDYGQRALMLDPTGVLEDAMTGNDFTLSL